MCLRLYETSVTIFPAKQTRKKGDMDMKKGSGYYEHEIKVKFTEGLINKSSDWQWLVECTEERFSAPKKISSVNEFLGAFSLIHDPYVILASVVDSTGDFKPSISSAWLKKLYDCVLLRSGVIEPDNYDEHAGLFALLGVISYATRLFNKLTGKNNLIDTRPIFYSNLHQLFDFTALAVEWPTLKCLAKRVNLSEIELVTETLRSNFEGIDRPINGDKVKKLMDDNFDADFLSFKAVDRGLFQTWQEALLCDAFRSSYQNRKLVPAISLGDGEDSADNSPWSECMVQQAKSSFEDDRAICLLETIEFAKWNRIPSACSQSILVDLAVNNTTQTIETAKTVSCIQCTALDLVIKLKNDSALIKEAQRFYIQSMNKLLKDRTDYDDLRYMSEHSFPMTKEQKCLLKTKCQTFFSESLTKVGSAHDLVMLFKEPLSATHCSQQDVAHALDLFIRYTESIDSETAELFYSAMVFMLDVLSNPDVKNDWTKKVIITLRHAWQDKYYRQVVAGMNCFEQDFSVRDSDVKTINEQFLESPHSLAQSLIRLSDDSISSILEEMSEHALLYVFSKISVSEFYPDHVHVKISDDDRSIDKMIADEVERVYKERSYRLINVLDKEAILDGFFEKLKVSIQLICSMIDIEPVYNEIVKFAPEQYELLPNPGSRPALGHLTQLFPVLENTIRNIGEFFSIVPFRAKKNSFNKLREVSGILADLIGSVRKLTGTIQGCGEFIFVYFVMYSSNGYNVRNDCIHGRQYQGCADVAFAFRLTAICTYMMLKRLRGLEAIMENGQADAEREEDDCSGQP